MIAIFSGNRRQWARRTFSDSEFIVEITFSAIQNVKASGFSLTLFQGSFDPPHSPHPKRFLSTHSLNKIQTRL
jgi:hypothetical protein